MKNNLYASVALLKYEQGEYEDHEIEVINVLTDKVTLSEATDIAKSFLKDYAKDGCSPSYTGMTIFIEYWKDGKIKRGNEIGDVFHAYDDDRDGLPVWQCDWEIGETEYFYPFD